MAGKYWTAVTVQWVADRHVVAIRQVVEDQQGLQFTSVQITVKWVGRTLRWKEVHCIRDRRPLLAMLKALTGLNGVFLSLVPLRSSGRRR